MRNLKTFESFNNHLEISSFDKNEVISFLSYHMKKIAKFYPMSFNQNGGYIVNLNLEWNYGRLGFAISNDTLLDEIQATVYKLDDYRSQLNFHDDWKEMFRNNLFRLRTLLRYGLGSPDINILRRLMDCILDEDFNELKLIIETEENELRSIREKVPELIPDVKGGLLKMNLDFKDLDNMGFFESIRNDVIEWEPYYMNNWIEKIFTRISKYYPIKYDRSDNEIKSMHFLSWKYGRLHYDLTDDSIENSVGVEYYFHIEEDKHKFVKDFVGDLALDLFQGGKIKNIGLLTSDIIDIRLIFKYFVLDTPEEIENIYNHKPEVIEKIKKADPDLLPNMKLGDIRTSDEHSNLDDLGMFENYEHHEHHDFFMNIIENMNGELYEIDKSRNDYYYYFWIMYNNSPVLLSLRDKGSEPFFYCNIENPNGITQPSLYSDYGHFQDDVDTEFFKDMLSQYEKYDRDEYQPLYNEMYKKFKLKKMSPELDKFGMFENRMDLDDTPHGKLYNAIVHDDVENINYILHNTDIDPSSNKNSIIKLAIAGPNYKSVEALLRDPRVSLDDVNLDDYESILDPEKYELYKRIQGLPFEFRLKYLDGDDESTSTIDTFQDFGLFEIKKFDDFHRDIS